jgi:phage terminase large subunit
MFGEMSDPDDLISFSSNIKQLQKLRSEVCRIPKKHNSSGMIQMMSKEDMKKLGISSPNIADAVMMALEVPELHDDFDYYEERSQHKNAGSLGY